MSSLAEIQDFLAQHRLAIVGVSREPRHFSRALLREFLQRGYDAVPVNPQATEIDDRPCFANLKAVQPPVDTVLLMTPPAVTDQTVRDCAQLGIRRVWMYRAHPPGAVSDEAVAFCRSQGISVVPGECPMMFLPGSNVLHRFHGLLKKLFGSYPR